MKGTFQEILYHFLEEYPEIGICLEINPNSPQRDELVGNIKKIKEENSEWEVYNTDLPKSQPGIWVHKSHTEFLTQPNHIKSIESFFVKLLKKLLYFKKKYSLLNF